MDQILQILINLIATQAFNITKLIDPMLIKYAKECPATLEEYNRILSNINSAKQSLQETQANVQSVKDIVTTVNIVITSVDIGVTTLKALPIPMAFPPGVGLPMNLPITFSDILATLQKLISGSNATISATNLALEVILKIMEVPMQKLDTLSKNTDVGICAVTTLAQVLAEFEICDQLFFSSQTQILK